MGTHHWEAVAACRSLGGWRHLGGMVIPQRRWGASGGISREGTWWCKEQESIPSECAGASAGPLSAHRVTLGDHSWSCARVPTLTAACGWRLQFVVWFLDLWGLFMALSDPGYCWERSTHLVRVDQACIQLVLGIQLCNCQSVGTRVHFLEATVCTKGDRKPAEGSVGLISYSGIAPQSLVPSCNWSSYLGTAEASARAELWEGRCFPCRQCPMPCCGWSRRRWWPCLLEVCAGRGVVAKLRSCGRR